MGKTQNQEHTFNFGKEVKEPEGKEQKWGKNHSTKKKKKRGKGTVERGGRKLLAWVRGRNGKKLLLLEKKSIKRFPLPLPPR